MVEEKQITSEEERAIDSLNLDEVIEDSSNAMMKDGTAEEKTPPDMYSVEWHDYVMTKFAPNEVDDNGNPFIFGLRRVANLLLGEIVVSKSHVVKATQFLNKGEKFTLLEPATVEHTIRFANGKEYTEAADCYQANTDGEYSRFPTAMASTRAEGRALRKALLLQRVVSAEELTKVPLEESSIDGQITESQINFIDILCRRCKIDVLTYINSGTKKYEKIKDIPYGVALKMTEHLSGLCNDNSKIPPELSKIPYNPNWKGSEC